MADKILVEFEANTAKLQQSLDQAQKELLQTGAVGQSAFDDIQSSIGNMNKAIDEMLKKLNKTPETINKTKKEFNGLQNSINQISREMPAFAVSMNTGFLAISNNLPILFDEITRIKQANADLAKEGKQTQSVLKQVGASIFSVGTLLSVGVTLLTLYGGKIIELVGSLLKGKSSFDQFKVAVKAVNEAFSDKNVANKAAEFLKLQQDVNKAKQGSGDKEKVLKVYNKTFGETLGVAKNLNEAEQIMIKNKDSYIKSLVDRAAATNTLNKAAEVRLKIMELEQSGHTIMEKSVALAKDFFGSWFGMSQEGSLSEQITRSRQKQIDTLNKEYEALLSASSNLMGEDLFMDDGKDKEKKKKEEDEELHRLQRIKVMYEAQGRDVFEITKEIYDRQIFLAKDDLIKQKDLINEKKAYIIKTEQERYDEFNKLAQENEKMLADYYSKIFWDDVEKRKKAHNENVKNSTQAVRDEYLYQLEYTQMTYAEEKRMLDEALEGEYITREEYAQKTMELENKKAAAIVAGMQAAATALGGFSELAGETTEAGKALAIAETTISTFLTAQQAFSGLVKTIPGPVGIVLGAVAAAGAIASGIGRVNKIRSVNVPKKKAKDKTKTVRVEQSFKDGVVDLQGPGTETSDSIPAWLSKGESVIKARSTKHAKDELAALNESYPNYLKLLHKKHVEPALEQERERNAILTNRLLASAIGGGMNDKNIVKELKEVRKSNDRAIDRLSENLERSKRKEAFEKKLYK